MAEQINDAPIEKEMQSSYIDYAMSVIVGRALPDARDGLKPAQRRILYAMYKLGNTHNSQTKKSVRIVGECFTKDTLVLASTGLIPIQDIAKGDTVYTQNGLNKVSEIYVMPKRKLLKVGLANGIENVVTESQQFRILTKDWKLVWKNANELTLGDYVVTRSEYPEIRHPVKIGGKELNGNIAYLLGQLLSDGFVIHDNDHQKYHRVGFCSKSRTVIARIVSCLSNEFSYEANVEDRETEYQNSGGQVMIGRIYQIRVSNRKVCDFFIQQFDLLGRKAWNKRIPRQIFSSPKDIVFEFLSGLIDGDGSVHASRTEITYTTTSRDMSNQIMVLLHHLGIHGKKYLIPAKDNVFIVGGISDTREVFNLEFTGVNAQRLAINLHLESETKKEMCESLMLNTLKKTDHDIIPWAGEKIFTELSNHHISSGWYLDTNGNKFRSGIKYGDGAKIRYCSYLHNVPLHISQIIEWGIQEKLNRIGSGIAPFINSIISNNLTFSPVRYVEETGEDITYDIQVDEEHALIANGMVAHNCIGKYHPHGDLAVYDTLARMAQTFSMNHTLVQGQGNFGSIDGDNPAAPRYTEVRLESLAEEMLQDLEKEAVRFVPNFDNTEEEPIVLPSKVPNLMLNGSSGIAVGVATNILPHNLGEIADAINVYIDNPAIEKQDLLQVIKGPDFATGGVVFHNENLLRSYMTGRGSVTLRGKATIEEGKNKRIIITEIPYTVNKATLVEKIAELVKDKRIQGISYPRDESDKKGIRVVIEVHNDAHPEYVLTNLYAHTQMEITLPVMNIAVLNNSLHTLNIKEMIKIFVDHRVEVIKKRTAFDLRVASDKLHIVEGLTKAVDSIDETINLIKKSSDSKSAVAGLMKRFEIDEKQAAAIMELRIGRLTNLDVGQLKEDKADLEKSIKNFKEILENETKVFKIIKDETTELKTKYGRRGGPR